MVLPNREYGRSLLDSRIVSWKTGKLSGAGQRRSKEHILFTLFHEENNGRPTCPSLIQGFPRNYDFTFGDIEPVVIGACFHTILTVSTQRFTLLLDNIDNKSPPDYWSIFYDLHIDTKTSDEILAQLENSLFSPKVWKDGILPRTILFFSDNQL